MRVGSWQSMSWSPATTARSASRGEGRFRGVVASAAEHRFAERTRRPMSTPYRLRPTSCPSRRTSTLCAWPRACSSQYAACISGRDPGAGGVLAPRGAGVDHGGEVAIESHLKATISQMFLRKAARAAEFRRTQALRADSATTTTPVGRPNTTERCRAGTRPAGVDAERSPPAASSPSGSSSAWSSGGNHSRSPPGVKPGDGLVHRGAILNGRRAAHRDRGRARRFRARIRPRARPRDAGSRQWHDGSADRRSSAWTRSGRDEPAAHLCVQPCVPGSKRRNARVRCRTRCPGDSRVSKCRLWILLRRRPSSGRQSASLAPEEHRRGHRVSPPRRARA